MNLNDLYRPITASPFANDDTYMEIEPCDALKPYIRCFWGAKTPYKKAEGTVQSLVVPDTCMDIIFNINYTENTVTNSFCGINDLSFMTGESRDKGQLVSTFAIRFYAWTAILFSEESMKGVKNAFFDTGYHFSKLKKQLQPMLYDVSDIYSRVAIMEEQLLKHIHLERENTLVLEGVREMIKSRGNVRAGELGKNLHVSNRHLERLFMENTGISPKKLSSLIRFQYLLNDIVYQNKFDIQDEILKLGYTDQAHLLKDFRRFHTMSLKEARKYAWKEVAFLQESENRLV